MIKEFIYFLRVILSPSYWLRVKDFDRHWDKSVRSQLINPVFYDLNDHTVRLNGKEIWVANRPYGGVTNCRGSIISGMPSRRTVMMFYDALDKYKDELRKQAAEL